MVIAGKNSLAVIYDGGIPAHRLKPGKDHHPVCRSIDVQRMGRRADAVINPGMKILQFAFDSEEANDYIPYNYTKNCLVYTGTHDNDTVMGWIKTAKEEDRKYLLDYLNSDEKDLCWDLIRLAMSSVAYTAIFPMQDLLGLGNESRMNLPGTTINNWKWRAKKQDFSTELAEKLAHLTRIFGRSDELKMKK